MTGGAAPRALRARLAAVAAGLCLVLVAACSSGPAGTADDAVVTAGSGGPSAPADRPTDDHGAGSGEEGEAAPVALRPGERFTRLRMPRAYTPSAPNSRGTDDYRCFLLDPGLARDTFVTGIDIAPGNPDVVHHVILFRVPPDSVAAARAKDAGEPGQGWTCFGGTGLDNAARLDNAPWLGAWAPGGGERLLGDDVGVPLQAGEQVVMQVHYNLLAGRAPDRTTARLRTTTEAGGRGLRPLETMLLPAPVELPCRSGHDDGPLCDRNAALADVRARFGETVGGTANYVHLLCGYEPAGPVQTCDQTVEAPVTVRAVAGHMHLLGRSIRVTVNPGTARARRILDIPVWNFDDQGAEPVRPVHLRRGDTVQVTCRHSQRLRDLLPAFEGQPDRYVVWGEGTTDEMCLGILLVTRP